MILSTQKGLFKFKYMIFDLIKLIEPVTQYKARKRKTEDGVNDIENGAIDEEDRKNIEDLIRSGALEAYDTLTYLVNGVVLPPPQKTFSWRESGTESRDAVVITISQKDWMADTVPHLVNEFILRVIKEYALREWYKMNGMVTDAQLHDAEFTKSVDSLLESSRLRRYPAKKPNQFLP